jgi:hypothetical protein
MAMPSLSYKDRAFHPKEPFAYYVNAHSFHACSLSLSPLEGISFKTHYKGTKNIRNYQIFYQLFSDFLGWFLQ